MKALARLWRGHRLALLGFMAATAVTLFFGIRLVVFTLYWADPAHRQQQISGWMTPGYVARSWDIPVDDLARTLRLEPRTGQPLSLAEIAALRGVEIGALIAEIEASIAASRTDPASAAP